MIPRPPSSTPTDTPFPYTTPVRSFAVLPHKCAEGAIHSIAVRFRSQRSIIRLGREPLYLLQPGFDRRQPFRFDRRFVEIAGEGIADLAVRIFLRCLQYLLGALLRQDRKSPRLHSSY